MKLKVENSLCIITIGQMTHTDVSTTHYYPRYSHKSIISLHGSLLNTVTFFPLGLQWLLLFFLVTFFPSQNCYFLSITFFPVTFFPSTGIST